MATAIGKQRIDRGTDGVVARSADVSSPGLSLPVQWSPVVGATDVEVTRAALTLEPALAEETFPDVPVASEGNHRVVTVPSGRSVKSVGLQLALNPGERLTLSLPALRGGWEAPIFASTGVSNGAMAPESPQGASFANNLLNLPHAVAAAKLRLSKVTGGKIADFQPLAFDVTKVHLTATTPPRNLRVLGPDQAPVWQAPELPEGSPEIVVDLRTPLEIAFRKLVAQGATPSATVTVAADAPGRAFVKMGAVQGALLRVEQGITTIALDGVPRPLASSGPLASEQPTSVTGDLTVRYAGLRILEPVSDPMPPTSGAVSGVIAGVEPALRMFPPEAFDGIQPARIGVVGRAPEDCELSLELVRLVGPSAGPPLRPPAVLSLKASRQIDVHWADVPAGPAVAGPVGILARANRGRFFWVAAGDHPATRIAIRDPDPGGRPLRIGAATLPVAAATVERPKFAFPAAAFRDTFPLLSSELFLILEISDLTLRYAR
jgi:hypothetical protein